MKYKLLSPQMGRPEGTVVTLVSDGVQNKIVADPDGNHISVPCSALEEQLAQEEASEKLKSLTEELQETPAPEPELVERLVVSDQLEEEARLFYDDYCAAVGGKAHNGDPLPPAEEFFEDPKKQKQANAYRTAAGLSYDRFVAAAITDGEDLFKDSAFMRAKLVVTNVKASDGQEAISMMAVAAGKYPEDGSDENNTYAKFSPSAMLDLTVANPALLGKVARGQTYYVDFIPAECVGEPAEKQEEAPPAAQEDQNPPETNTPPVADSIEEVKSSEDPLETAGETQNSTNEAEDAMDSSDHSETASKDEEL